MFRIIHPALSGLPLLLALVGSPARADGPQVMVDTIPLHALVSRVMAGVGEADLLLPPGASPHDFQLRPSDAGRLARAQIVFWTGDSLVPWLVDPLATLAPDAVTLALLETDGWSRLSMRQDAAFAAAHDLGADDAEDHAEAGHDHAEAGHDHAEAGHDHGEAGHDHAGEGHDHAEAGHDHAKAGHDHAHDGTDPHAWLDPAVAAVWLGLIADTLSEADPDSAAAYRANADAGAVEMVALQAELATVLAPVQGRAYIVPHDAYQYFEVAFGLPATGAIALSDASTPGPARIAALRDLVAAGDVSCILTDPQTSPDWAQVLNQSALARTAMTDPDGSTFAPGADLYPAMMRALATALADCLAG